MAFELADAATVASPVRPLLPESPDRADSTLPPAVPLMAEFSNFPVSLASPVLPLSPELPVTACGSAMAVELAGPVLPVLVEDDCAHAVPESPDCVHGDCVRLALPPLPPLTLSEAMESPPLILPTPRRLLRPLSRRRALASPARPDLTVPLSPPRPPLPPVTLPLTALATSPVVPETDAAVDWAPELALEFATPAAVASPVRPVFPESPERTEASGLAVPLMPALLAVRLAVAAPVLPESPEPPEVAVGLAFAVERFGLTGELRLIAVMAAILIVPLLSLGNLWGPAVAAGAVGIGLRVAAGTLPSVDTQVALAVAAVLGSVGAAARVARERRMQEQIAVLEHRGAELAEANAAQHEASEVAAAVLAWLKSFSNEESLPAASFAQSATLSLKKDTEP